MLSIQHDKSDFGRNSPLTERRTSSANHLFTLHTASHADHRVAIPILHVKYRAQFLLGVGWGGMSYWVYVTLSCHNWKHLTFATAVPILFTSFVYRINVYWSVIHGIKRKPHLSVVWNWYHFVAIAILHQYAIATQWYQFHTTDAWWFSLRSSVDRPCSSYIWVINNFISC